MRFVDLFAGLGGFHLALSSLGHDCVFASEIDPLLQKLYEQNFGMPVAGDIRSEAEQIPDHDILCAGFPCTPFSKAGNQQGLEHTEEGDLFNWTLKILQSRRPTYLLMENVPNLTRHRGGLTWSTMARGLAESGYVIDKAILSPHRFGVPQIRERLFIVGVRDDLVSSALSGDWFRWPEPAHVETSISTVLDDEPDASQALPAHVELAIDAWQKFIDLFPKSEPLPSFPIWAAEFGADYPYEEETPVAYGVRKLKQHRGAFGRPLEELPETRRLEGLPSYAMDGSRTFPRWKRTFIRQNRMLYEANRTWIDRWLPQLDGLTASLRKFEWNCHGELRDLQRHVLQVRPSGLRVKRSSSAPSLVSMTTSQLPIIPWENRYMTIRECARLQSLDDLPYLPESPSAATRALGNAVNAEIVRTLAERLVGRLNSRQQRVPRGDRRARGAPALARDA